MRHSRPRTGSRSKLPVRAGCGLPVSRRAERSRSGAEARDAAGHALRTALHRGLGEESEERPARGSEPIVLSSGNLALISFPDVPERLSRERQMLATPLCCARSPITRGIGFLLVRSEEHGSVVLAASGPRATSLPPRRFGFPGDA